MELRNLKINALGDSIIEGISRVANIENRFTDRIARDYAVVCRSYGIGGTRIAKQHELTDYVEQDMKYFSNRVDELDPDADVVLVFGGTNDYGHGDAPIGTMEDRTADTFYGGLHELYSRLIEKYPNGQIVVMTPLHRMKEDNPYGEGAKKAPTLPLSGYVEVIREVAAFYQLPVLDLYKNSALRPDREGIIEKYMPDGLHPNDEGHAILAKEVVEFLEQL